MVMAIVGHEITLMRYLDSTALCEEVRHEVCLIVWEQAAHFNATSPVATWIFGIAYGIAAHRRGGGRLAAGT